MSYLVLACKHRPRNFSEMVGQEHVVRALCNALQSQRLHHAYLFTGTRGVGKTTVSRILAKSLNCQGPDGQGDITATPCGVCQACRDIDSGRFVDYTELDAASNRGVEEVQSLLEQAVYKPVQGRFKVFMIDEVHMLTNTAFNAMLKTLEEPPEYLKFVLATTDPQKVPVTVLSRCLQFNLRPMAPETILEHLQRVLDAEQVACDTPSLRLLARAARGSMRDALSLTDQAIAFGAGALQEATVRQMLGSVDRSYVFRLIEALARGDGKTVVETSEALRLNGLSAASTLDEMSSVLQRMAVVQAVPDAPQDGDPDAADTARLAQRMPADETQLLYSMCLHGRAELGLAPDEYAALTMVLLRLLAFKPIAGAPADNNPRAEKKTLNDADRVAGATVSAAETQHMPVAASPTLGAAAAQSAPPAAVLPPGQVLHVLDQDTSPPSSETHAGSGAGTMPTRAVAAQPGAVQVLAMPVLVQADSRAEALAGQLADARLSPTEDGAFWHTTVQQLIRDEAIAALVRELALQSQLVARDTDQWLLRVERESLNQAGNRDRLGAALSAAGYSVRLAVEVGRVTDSPARRNAQAAAQRQLEAERTIFEAPFVQSIMRDFGATVVPGTIKAL
ncbi:MAG: DNA polymerase III subunit gamma/tau [Rhodoferax sp.]|nr:DNA polymerase III subunit gamma/tau [Rhodoferax sp.]